MLTKIAVPCFTPYVPANSVAALGKWLSVPGTQLRITKHRSSKLGDYRPLNGGKQHLISVNGNLNKYAFLITLVHEIAHMNNYIAYRSKVKPHGQEWKDEFKRLMAEFNLTSIFPDILLPKIESYMANPKASSSSDISLSLALREFDATKVNHVVLSQIEEGAIFNTRNGRAFVRGARQKKRIKCKELKTGRLYLFSPIAEVLPA
jgi:hypothetical protein